MICICESFVVICELFVIICLWQIKKPPEIWTWLRFLTELSSLLAQGAYSSEDANKKGNKTYAKCSHEKNYCIHQECKCARFYLSFRKNGNKYE